MQWIRQGWAKLQMWVPQVVARYKQELQCGKPLWGRCLLPPLAAALAQRVEATNMRLALQGGQSPRERERGWDRDGR